MRRQTIAHLDFETGQTRIDVRDIPEDASIEHRFDGLRASAQEALGDIEPGTLGLSVICDGCGHREPVSAPQLPLGWVSTEHGEFCPGCLQ